jgi:hypothetical protein
VTDRRTALVTGASTGIGREFARLLARDGYDIVMVDLSGAAMEDEAQELEERHGITTTVLPKDLGRPGSAGEIARNIAQRRVRVDVLINDAWPGSEMFELNGRDAGAILRQRFGSLTELTRQLVPEMVRCRWGRVLNAAPSVTRPPQSLLPAYRATRTDVLRSSYALAGELRDTGVTVTAFCPGPPRRTVTAEEIADRGYEAMKRGRPQFVTGAGSRILVLGTRLRPRAAGSGAGDASGRLTG